MKSNRVLLTGLSVIVAGMLFFLNACDNKQKELQSDVEEFQVWVNEQTNELEDSADDSWENMKEAWSEVESEYGEMVKELDEKRDEMSEETREEFKEARQEYLELKNEIKTEINRREGVAKVEDALMISGTDDDLKEVTADNILSVYQSFVNTVGTYKDDFTAKQWTLVETYWDMLNNRKNEVEDDLPTEDNTEIAQLKLEYAGYKTVYKTGAKMESKDTENK